MGMLPYGIFARQCGATRRKKKHESDQPRHCEPRKSQTANRLFFERPMRSSKAAPPNSSCFSPAGPGVAGRALIRPLPGPPCVGSDSLVDDRGCLTDGRNERPSPAT